MARSIRKTDKVATVVETPVVEAEQPVKEEVKPVKKKFAPDEEVDCRAVLVGRTYVLGKRSGNLYGFLGKDDVIGIEYRDLAAEVREWTRAISRPMIIIEDEDFIAEFPKLAKFYKDLYPTSELEAMLRKPANQVMAIVPSLPRGIQDSLKGLAADMVRTGALDSVSTIKALDEFWGTQLSILTGLTEQ